MPKNKIKIAKFNQQCTCPICGADSFESETEKHGDNLYIMAYCSECGARYTECYELKFITNTDIQDKDRNEYITIKQAEKLINKED